MRYVCTIWLLPILASCSSIEQRYASQSHETLRIVIDDSVQVSDYRDIQVALLEQNGKYEVVDRQQAWHALRREQERQHRSEADRFRSDEKYALWAELFGAGGIISAHKSCMSKYNIFRDEYRQHCTLFLSLTSASTSRIIAATKTEVVTSEPSEPAWASAVESLTSKLPSKIPDLEVSYTERMKEFRKKAAKRAVEQEKRNWKDAVHRQEAE